MCGEQYVNLVKDLVDMEKRHAEALRILTDTIRHPVMKALLLGIAHDSIKHALFYSAIMELLTKYQPTISQNEFGLLYKEIVKHIETEVRMMEIARELFTKSNDPRVKLLLAAIYDDETKHHKVLTSIRDSIGGEYVVSNEDIWNVIWRDSPWHGTPGG